MPVPNFNQFGELQFFGPNLSKKKKNTLGWSITVTAGFR